MGNRNTWRFALGLSLALHALLVAGIGWYAGRHALQADEMENLMELELASDSPPSFGQETAAATATQPVAAEQSKPVIQQVVQERPEPIKPQASQTVAEPAEAMSVQETSAAVAAHGASITAYATGETAKGISQGQGEGQGPQGSSNVIPPRIVKKVEPAFPEAARRAGREGTVIVKMAILENGYPDNVRVWESSGREDMDQAAVEAVEHWRFVPARDQQTGREVSCITTVPVAFRLQS